MLSSQGVLISSAGRRVALVRCFRSALRRLGLRSPVLAIDASPRASALRCADEAHVVPSCTDEAFIPAVLRLCETRRIGLIVPTIDTELPIYAANAARFADRGVAIAISGPTTIGICADKVLTHRWFLDNGVLTPRQAAPEVVLANPGAWRFPLMVKPVNGSAGRGVAVALDALDLAYLTRREPCIVQELANGFECTVDVLVNRNGDAVCAVPRRRLAVRGGEVSMAQTMRCEPLESLAVRVCESLPGAYGVLNVQVFVDAAANRFSAIEVNARFGGGFPLSCQAGADFPLWLLEELLGRPSSASARGWEDGLTMLRYDDAVYVPRADREIHA